MKKSIFLIAVGALFLTSCEEKAPVINYSEIVAKDTTYPGPVPATEPHHVLVEEFTGQTCSNCPAAHDLLRQLSDANPGRVHVVGLYVKGIAQTIPATGAKYDFRQQVSSDIGSSVFGGISAIPSGGVDRVPVSGNILLNKADWSATLNSRMNKDDSLNLSVTSTWDDAKQQATITATIVYTKSVMGLHNLSLVVVEDSMVDKQELPFGQEDEAYLFTNVLREMITAVPMGDPLYPAIPVKEPGRVIKKIYTYKPATMTPAMNLDHCRIIAFVNSTSGSNREVYQAAEVKLRP